MQRLFAKLLIVVLVLLHTNPVFGQEVDGAASLQGILPFPGIETIQTTGNLACFDYYQFGSVQADLQTNLAETVPGATITFSGDVSNANDYPLLDGTLFVKIFKRDESTFSLGDGNSVVDQFVIKNDIVIPANGSVPLSFDWQVPNQAEGGEYYAAYFFATNERYNLMGLSFTDDVVGNTAPFGVVSDNVVTKLSKVDTTLNERDHNFAAFPLTFSATETVTVRTTITNQTDEERTIPLQWNQFAWDAMNPDNRRNTKTEIVTLEPNETKELTYVAKEQREPVVYITALTQDNDAKSVLNIRYVREGIPETRINFPGVTNFPIVANTETTLFACAHSTNEPIVPGNTLTLNLKDKAGNTIHEYIYEGDISGAMSGFGNTFTPDRNINYALLTATLEREGVVIEEVQIEYDCTAIPGTECLPEAVDDGALSLTDLLTNPYVLYLFIGTILLLLVVAGFTYKQKHKRINSSTDNTTMPLSLLFLALLLPSLLIPPQQAEAKTTSWNYTDGSGTYFYAAGWYGYQAYDIPPSRTGGGWVPALTNPNYTITYGADVFNNNTGAIINDGATLSVGDVLRFEPRPHQSADISWFGTGYSSDSPNGDWVPNAAASHASPNELEAGNTAAGTNNRQSGSTRLACRAQDYVGPGPGGVNGDGVYIPLSVAPPNITITHTGTAGLSCNSGNRICTVTSPGTINSTFTFGPTFGKLYYRYTLILSNVQNALADPQTCTNGNVRGGTPCTITINGCFGDNTPLRRNCDASNPNITQRCNGIPDYDLQVPQRQISFTLNVAGPANVAPATPTISGPTSALVNSSQTFTINGGSDPDGDQVRYGIANAACTSVSQWLPGSGYFTPGSQSYPRSWGSAGTYTIYVLSEDSNGARSGCGSHTITINNAPAPTANLTINGSNGPLTVNKNSTLNLSWSSSNAATCTLFGAGLPGGSVPLSGSRSVAANVITSSPESYVLSCSGATDSVAVSVQNQLPNPPTIAQTAGNNEASSVQTFSFTGTDPDNDQIYYEIDWDNNSMVDVSTPASSYVNSGTTLNGNRSWPTPGTYTFQVRTVDFDNARSGWTQHSITINPSPPPTAMLEVQIGTGGWGTGNPPPIDTNDTVTLRWSSTLATSCTGTNFNTNGNTSNATGLGVPTPTPGNSITFTLACTGSGGTDTEAITVSVGLPNLNRPIVTHNLSTTFDPVTGEYDYIDIRFQTTNDGQSGTVGTAPYSLQFDSRTPVTGTIPLLTRGSASPNFSERINNVTFGSHTATIVVDTNNSVAETNEGDNSVTYNFGGAIPPPNPNLGITVSRPIIQAGETVMIDWNTGAAYPMNCSVFGPGVSPINFDPSVTGPSGDTLSQPITAMSEFTLRCTEPITNTTFTDTATVEIVGTLEEI